MAWGGGDAIYRGSGQVRSGKVRYVTKRGQAEMVKF